METHLMSVDFNRVGLLLHVVTEAVGHGVAYRDIVSEANAELLWHNDCARQDGIKRAAAKTEEEAQAKAEEQARADELAAEAEAKLKAEAQQKIDDEIKTKAQIIAAAQAKSEADAKAAEDAKDVTVVPSVDTFPPDHVDSVTTFTSDNGRRI
jgi:hypothetical protein